ncbi:MAG: hypothetical protein WB607_08040 [Candidatus Acidiferrum sp.]
MDLADRDGDLRIGDFAFEFLTDEAGCMAISPLAFTLPSSGKRIVPAGMTGMVLVTSGRLETSI